MVKLSKAAIMTISGGSAVIITSSTVLANLALKKESGKGTTKNPLNRDSNYHSYSLLNKIQSNAKLKNLVDCVEQDKQIVYVINEKKFKNEFIGIVQDALKATSTFSQSYLNYVIECNYKLKNTRSVLIDLVWYEQNSKSKFYDQFELVLATN